MGANGVLNSYWKITFHNEAKIKVGKGVSLIMPPPSQNLRKYLFKKISKNNAIPNCLKTCKTVSGFKAALKTYLCLNNVELWIKYDIDKNEEM